MPDTKALFNKTDTPVWPTGVTPHVHKIRKGRSGIGMRKAAEAGNVDPTKSGKPGILYLIKITLPTEQIFYKVGITSTSTTDRFKKTLLDVETIIELRVRTMRRAFQIERQILLEYNRNRGRFPDQYKFKGHTECLLLTNLELDTLVTFIRSMQCVQPTYPYMQLDHSRNKHGPSPHYD